LKRRQDRLLVFEEAQHYVRNELLGQFNLENDRVVWDIAGLCQVLYWERHGVDLENARNEK
jgi:hypothetical protein